MQQALWVLGFCPTGTYFPLHLPPLLPVSQAGPPRGQRQVAGLLHLAEPVPVQKGRVTHTPEAASHVAGAVQVPAQAPEQVPAGQTHTRASLHSLGAGHLMHLTKSGMVGQIGAAGQGEAQMPPGCWADP